MDETQNRDDAGKELQARVIKRAGQSCITLFVVFVIALFAFGKTPLNRVTGEESSRINFNVISCLGIALGFYALFFIPIRLRTILKLTTAKKVLGLIGGAGLIAHSIIAISLSYSAPQAAVTIGYSPMAQSGSEQWQIDGKEYRIESTYYLALPEGLQYTITIEYPWKFEGPEVPMNDERALEIVFPLMKHAYEKGFYKRANISKAGQGALSPSRIGVAIIKVGEQTLSGYRVALSLDEIKRRIEQENPSASKPTGDNQDIRTP
ncbi:MAG: hypothetical protein KAV00_18370 [Phycisphaerae bacterium]|nr:hypothetical protein [Phycisphaerae bacterium]